MKLSTLLFASVVGATLLSVAGTASADRWYHRDYGRVVVRPYARTFVEPIYVRPRVVVEPALVAPTVVAPVVVERPVVVRRPYYYSRPIVVRRGWHRY